MGRTFDLLTSYAASGIELGAGLVVGRLGARPAQMLKLYEYVGCPMCLRVREVMTHLDPDAKIYPCPKGGTRFRPKAPGADHRAPYPQLVDPNTGETVFESARIVEYLFSHYGKQRPSLWARRPGPIAMLALLPRGNRGSRARPSRMPKLPLDLWSFEASPYCRLPREVLCELQLPHRLHNVGKGSPSRAAFVERSGKMQVPYLVDDNTGAAMFESADIVDYLERTYAI